MRVLITGDAGFVGRHMKAAFQQRGDEVLGVELTRGYDALDFFRTPWFSGVDLAVHCAAHIGGRAGIDNSPLAVATNLALDSWFFRWLQLSQVPRAVYFSSSAVYPVDLQNDLARPVALSETMVRGSASTIGRPDATYGWGKLTGEQLAEHTRKAGHHVLVVRPFSGYGSDQELDYPFPSFIRRAVHLADPFEVWGDGRQVRDWVHISDVVGAVLALLDADTRTEIDQPVNIGSGAGVCFDELAEIVIEARGGGYRPQIKHLTGWPTGVAHRVADVDRMREFYQPRVSLEDGIREALHRHLLSGDGHGADG